MTPELERELVEAWNSGYCIPSTDPNLTGLDRLRAAWAEATEQERAIFKEESYGPSKRENLNFKGQEWEATGQEARK
jgi:hypothetical protein